MGKYGNSRIVALILVCALALAVITGCVAQASDTPQTIAAPAPGSGDSPVAATDGAPDDTALTVVAIGKADVNAEDLESDWSAASSVKITLNGSSATVGGTGATVKGGVVTISAAGTYVLSGKLSNGQIVVAATNKDLVRLVLNGVDISNLSGAPVYASQCDKLIVTLAEGTTNTLTDGGGNFKYADGTDEEPNAALFSKDDLTINGTGSLTVNAGFNNGIGTKDDLLVVSGNLTVNSANHGLRGNDSVTVLDGIFKINAGNDGIQTSNDTDTEKGWISVAGGIFDITAAHDGIQAENTLNIADGTFSITAGNKTATATTTRASATTKPVATAKPTAEADTPATTEPETVSDSYKGIKATSNIVISEGSFTIDSADDSIHSNGDITVSGGTFALSTQDDGIHADGSLNVVGGKITVKESYEGLEAAYVNISGGTINVTASDDAINAAGGNGGNTGGGRFGGDSFSAGGGYSINISGGTIKALASSDCIDSNGTVNISGGTVYALSNAARDGEAIDANGAIAFTGGTIVYGGSLNTGGTPGTGSTQSCVYANTAIASGSEVTVKGNGATLISFTAYSDCRVLALSSPEIRSGQSYEIYSGGVLVATVAAGTGSGGGSDMRGGGMGGRAGSGAGDSGVAPGGKEPRAPGGGMKPRTE